MSAVLDLSRMFQRCLEYFNAFLNVPVLSSDGARVCVCVCVCARARAHTGHLSICKVDSLFIAKLLTFC